MIRFGNIIKRFIDTTNKNRIQVNRFLNVSEAIYDTENRKIDDEIRRTTAEKRVPSGSRIIGKLIGEE